MEQVSWDDAQKFLKKLNQMEKTDTYRLPTEAEWEYACRAGAPRLLLWGRRRRLDKYAWYGKQRQERPIRWANCSPMPGASTTCTATSGNGARTGTGNMPLGRWSIPKGLMPDTGRVLRGGSWYTIPQDPAFGRARPYSTLTAATTSIGFSGGPDALITP